jgi:hypothetical protein
MHGSVGNVMLIESGDILEFDFREGNFDLVVSNLVYHNLGRQRFTAYKRLAACVPKSSYVVLGELFFGNGPDIKVLSLLFREVKELPTAGLGSAYKLLIMSAPRIVSRSRVTS